MFIPTTNPDKKIYINNVLFFIIFALFIVSSSYVVHSRVVAGKINCKSFPNRVVAQQVFDQVKVKAEKNPDIPEIQKVYKQLLALDRDKDGKVCEK